MRLSNQIARIVDDQYLWKECINFFDFLHGYIHQGKVAHETNIFGWVCPGIPSHTQTCLNFPRAPLGSFWGIPRYKIIQNQKLINLVNKSFFY